jgi:hypothetical protein
MWRKLTVVLTILLASGSVFAGNASAAEGAGGTGNGSSEAGVDEVAGSVGVTVGVSGFSDAQLRVESRCVEYGPAFHPNRRPTNEYRSNEVLLSQIGDPDAGWFVERVPADEFDISLSVSIPTHRQWRTWCEGLQGDPPVMVEAPGSERFPWIELVSTDTLVPQIVEHLEEVLTEPALYWPGIDREHGWLYVQLPMDFRVAAQQPVTLHASVSNLAGSASAWVTATPVSVLFEPGEPNGQPIACTYPAATAGYHENRPNACAVTWHHSSSLSNTTYFPYRITTVWNITSNATTLTTGNSPRSTTGNIQIAEIQAILTN